MIPKDYAKASLSVSCPYFLHEFDDLDEEDFVEEGYYIFWSWTVWFPMSAFLQVLFLQIGQYTQIFAIVEISSIPDELSLDGYALCGAEVFPHGLSCELFQCSWTPIFSTRSPFPL